MKKQSFSRLKKIVENFSHAKVMVVGDLILDEFIWGNVSRISPEAPVPVVLVRDENFMPGGASNVVNNIASLGGKASIVGVVGNDERGALLKDELKHRGVDVAGIAVDDTRPTTLKTRIVAQQHQQVVRIDRESAQPLRDDVLKRLVSYIAQNIADFDAVIIEDYGKGVITPGLLAKILPLAKNNKKIILVDPKEEHFSYYKGVTAITPNNHEASRAVGFEIKPDSETSLDQAGKRLLKKMDCAIALITLGEHGMAVCCKGKKMELIPTVAQEVYDVSGAGDTVIGTYALALSAGADPVQAAHIANCAAGIVVGKVGIAVVTPAELIDRIKKELDK